MEIAGGGILMFLLVLFSGLLCYMPIYKINIERYQLRLKPEKKRERNSTPAQRKSTVLTLLSCLGKYALSLFPSLLEKRSLQLLIISNYRQPEHAYRLAGSKIALSCSTALSLAFISSGNGMLYCIPSIACAWLIPNYILSARAKQRQSAIIAELPTMVDLMVVCAQAGLGLLSCIDKVSRELEKTCPEISGEFRQMLQDISLFAKPTNLALQAMGDRCQIEELSSMISTLISCDSKGAELAYPLKQISTAIRERLKRKKEEEASKTPVKMVPVIMFFIMPLILCPMLGPAVIIILEALVCAPPQ